VNTIHIEGKIFIEVDEHSATIKEYTGKLDKDGKELYNVLGYFSKLQSAVKKLLSLNIARSKTKDLNELLERLNDIEWKIEDAISKIKLQGDK
jgi:HEPN domain-containing protein